VQTTVKCFISLPTEEAHHHPTGTSIAMAQNVHPQVINKIHELVLADVSESMEMKCHLKYNCLSKDEPPDPNDRAFFPTYHNLSPDTFSPVYQV